MVTATRTILFSFLTFFAALLHAGAQEVTARLEPQSVPAGQGALLTIEVTGFNAERPAIPSVPGLIVEPRGQQRSFQSINGQTTISTTFTYAVGSQTPGDYQIPAIPIRLGNAEVKTQAMTLKVTPSANQAPPGMAPNGQPAAAPPDNPTADDALGFLTVEQQDTGRDHAWVGEITPMRIKAWFPENVQVRLGKPQPDGSAFTLHNLSEQPQQTREISGGKRYNVFTWFAGLSAAKEGSYAPTLTMKATVGWRERGRGPRGFNDPFFDGMFGQMVQKDIVLTSRSGEEGGVLEVRSLPAEGRPEDFTGAVGRFRIDDVKIPSNWTAGEPQEIQLTVGGEGNFNLLTQPDPQPASNWKTYPGQSDFTAKDAASFAGAQVFRFNAVPQKSGPQELAISIPFFNPDSGGYETAEITPKKLVVGGTTVTPAAAPVAAEAPPPPEPADPDQLAPLHTSGKSVASLTPFAWRSGFVPVCAAGGGLALLGLAFAGIRKVRLDPVRLAREATARATRAALQEASAMAGQGDVSGFFSAGRRALQARLAAAWGRPAQGISLTDVTARVPDDSPVTAFFREADRRQFSPGTAAGDDLPAWQARLEEAMTSLATPSTPVSSGTAAVVRVLTFLATLAAAGNVRAATMEEAATAFNAGQFAAAADSYDVLLQTEGPGAALYYNLGNARYRAGQPGLAILAWERAAVLAPRDPDIRANLAIARRKSALTGDIPALTWWQMPLAALSLQEWSAVAAGSALVAGLLVFLLCVARFLPGRRAGALIVLTVSVLLGALAGTALYLRRGERQRAVLTAAEPTLRISPIESAQSAGTPGTGRLVRLEKRHEDWAWITIPGTGIAGWVPATDVALVIPENS